MLTWRYCMIFAEFGPPLLEESIVDIETRVVSASWAGLRLPFGKKVTCWPLTHISTNPSAANFSCRSTVVQLPSADDTGYFQGTSLSCWKFRIQRTSCS